MARFNFDVSSLFNSLGNNNAFGSFNLSDYRSIKNGSYGKLLKSYYSTQKTPQNDKPTTSVQNKKEQNVDKTGLTQMKKEAEGLKNAVEAFNKDDIWKQTNGEYNTDKIAGAVKEFAKEYNDVVTQASKVNSKEISQSLRYMQSMTNTMSKALSKIGVNVGVDGKLSINEDVLKNANASSVKSLFAGAGAYGAQVEGKASEIARATVMNSGMYSNGGTLTSSLPGMFDSWI